MSAAPLDASATSNGELRLELDRRAHLVPALKLAVFFTATLVGAVVDIIPWGLAIACLAVYGVIIGFALTTAFGPASRRPLAVLNWRGLQVRSELKLAWEELLPLRSRL